MVSDFRIAEAGVPWILAMAMAVLLWCRHRKIKQTLEGTAKTLLGYYMVVIGASAIPETTGPLSILMREAFGVNGGVMNTEAFSAALLPAFGPMAIAVMLCAFGVNLLLARHTRCKGVFLTGHHYLYLSLLTVMILQTGGGLPWYATVPLGALLLGVYGWLMVGATRRVIGKTGLPDAGMANSSAEAALIGAFSARATGKSEDRYQPEERPHWANINSIPVAAFVSTFAAYVVVSCFAGFGRAAEILGEDSWVLNGLIRSLLYGAQIALLLQGIRMLMANIIEMFWSVASRCVLGLWNGLDASVLIGGMPRAWGMGFLASCVGGLVATVGMILLKMPFVPLMSPTSLYFAGGVAGVCANASGGKRATKLAGVLTGIVVTLLIGVMTAGLNGYTQLGLAYGETTYGIYGILLEWIARLFR